MAPARNTAALSDLNTNPAREVHMTEKRLQVGQAGEDAPVAFLREKGLIIISRNYRCPLGEIDIIAEDAGTTVFVEVRSRTGRFRGAPEESVNYKKGRKLKKLALYYMQSVYGHDVPCRIDLVAVMVDRHNLEAQSAKHYKGILAG